MRRSKQASGPKAAKNYRHPESESLLRPDVGTQAQFKKKKPPKTYRYDSSLSPALDWDGQNPAREEGERLIRQVLEAKSLEEAKRAAEKLRALGRPFLDWAGKAERLSFDVPTLPLFVHERLSTKAILETLKSHRRERLLTLFDLFGDPEHPIADQILRAYEHKDQWVNRMVLGDSLVVMSSLLHYESLGGQVQMIYMDPPYGVKFGSNFQPFVRKRDVAHNDDDDMTREPEMVQAYRDTWEVGLHSYLTYLRDRLLLCRELLAPSGSIFVQISDENLHHVREVTDEVFGGENFLVVICYRRLGMMVGETLQSSAHYLLWYAKDRPNLKHRKLFAPQIAGVGAGDHYIQVEVIATGESRALSSEEKANPHAIPEGCKPFQLISLATGEYRANMTFEYRFGDRNYYPGHNKHWRTTREGLDRLSKLGRIVRAGETLRYKQYLQDFPHTEITSIWEDTARDPENFYVVQTPSNVVRRCLLMTTDPGDLVLDPTCGSGTTACVAEQWGRRWITIDTSRVPLALARQRLLTATFPWYQLKDDSRGPAGGFVYKRKQNKKGEEVGGIVPHITLKSIANDEPPKEEVLVDRPEVQSGITRVSGPFCVEATLPLPANWEDLSEEAPSVSSVEADAHASYVDRMIEVLRKSPVLRLGGNRTVTLKNVRPPAKTLSLSAEAVVEDGEKGEPVAILFGPENGAVSERLVWEALREAQAKRYARLYVIGFAIQPNARTTLEQADKMVSIPGTYIQATPDLLMGDLLKNLRSSQIFSVCGLPEVKLHRKVQDGTRLHQVELLGLDVFDPVTTEVEHRKGDDVPAWLLDTDYNGLCFLVTQAFFPRTGAWDSLKRALKGEYKDEVWDHLSGTRSAPFEAGENQQVAVKVIDDRGNELLVVRSLEDAEDAEDAEG
ncbi:MAG: site-specific DNA-methyltransferase [Planctomycetes bacterium]|nr:site-specific DNA-methyltransferase [Planctomycetota bacterium]